MKELKLLIALLLLKIFLTYIVYKNDRPTFDKIINFINKYKESLIMALFIIALLVYLNYPKIRQVYFENFSDMNFEYNILDNGEIKDAVSQNEIDAIQLLNEIVNQKIMSIENDYPTTVNASLNNRLKSMIYLVRSSLLKLPSEMAILSASKAYASTDLVNQVDKINIIIRENQRKYFNGISNKIMDNSLRFLLPGTEKVEEIINDKLEINEDVARENINRIFIKYFDEYKENFKNIYFNQLLSDTVNAKYTSPDELTIYDVVDSVIPNQDLVSHYKYFSNFITIIIDTSNLNFNKNNYGHINEINNDIKNINEKTKPLQLNQLSLQNVDLSILDYSSSNIFSDVLSPLLIKIRGIFNTISSLNNVNELKNMLDFTITKLDRTINEFNLIMNHQDLKNKRIAIFDDASFQKYVTYLFFNDSKNVNFRNVAIRLFMSPSEYNQAMSRLDDKKRQVQESKVNATQMRADLTSGSIDNNYNIPLGYFKIGIKYNLSNEPLFLTVADKHRKHSQEHLNQYVIAMRSETADTDIEQLFYADIDGRIYNVEKKLCLTVLPSSGDPKELTNNDQLILAYPDEISAPLQRFKIGDNTISLVKDEPTKPEYYLTYNSSGNGYDVIVNTLLADPKQNKWFAKVVGKFKDQRSVFGRQPSNLTRNARNYLEISKGTVPPYSTYTYSFWLQVNNVDNTVNTRLPNAVFIKGNIDNIDANEDNKDKESSSTDYYRSPAVFIKYSADKTHYDLVVRLSTTKNIKEEFIISKPSVLKTTNDQQVWDHVEMVVFPKEFKIFINGIPEFKYSLVGTVIPNPYSLKITPGGGFSGKIHHMRYYNYARSRKEVSTDMYETTPLDMLKANIPIYQFSSSDMFSPPVNYEHYNPNSSRLHSSYGWYPYIPNTYSINSVAGQFYLQVNFDSSPNDPKNNYYKVEKMYIQGHGEKDAFIKKFKLAYYNHNDADWVFFRNEEPLLGSDSSASINTISSLDFVTNKVRIYPLDWHLDENDTMNKHRLGIRVGFDGITQAPNRCDRMVSVCSMDKMRGTEKMDRSIMGNKLSSTMAKLTMSEKRQKNLENEIDSLHTELNKMRIGNKLCPKAVDTKCLSDMLCSKSSDMVSQHAKAPKCNVNMADYELKENIKYGALCDHLGNVAPDKYGDKKQCVKNLKQRFRQKYDK